MLKLAVCDDDPFMVKEISDQLSKYMAEKNIVSYCVSCFSNGHSLLESDGNFDLIFLDIQMGHPDGMETAQLLRQRGNNSLLVFVTILKEYVFDDGPCAPVFGTADSEENHCPAGSLL